MIHTIREAFNELLAENIWMDDETRAVAKEKADAMNERIGYPDLLTDPEELSKEYINVSIVLAENDLEKIRLDNLFCNFKRHKFRSKKSLTK